MALLRMLNACNQAHLKVQRKIKIVFLLKF